MAEAAERSHVLLSVFHNRRWDGDFITIRKAWESGLLGEVYVAECCVMGWGGPRGWRGKKAHSGGVLFDWGAHLLDQALLLGGEPKAVTAWVADMRAWPESDIGNYGKVVVQFQSGLLYGVETGNLSRIPKPHWWIQGTKGALRKEGVDPQEAAMLKGDIAAAREDPANRAIVRTEVSGQMEELRLETERGDWREFYKNVAAAIRGEADLAVTPAQMTRLMSVYDAAMESVKTGRTVAL
jgi:scyllo-inositol 2-dehydrogenase (NADP+)